MWRKEMKTKTQVRTASAVALRRVAAVTAVLLTLCLVFMMPVGAEATVVNVGTTQEAQDALDTAVELRFL